ncbi:protein N-terminal asparagine amidohydrolase isoform X1 [Xiphophorus couchianus]|uniref:protein N-terminal asparagine amidohydrolase isoform X1 n=1 Tax=Xiphophorus couchianus TaxID=32473 RepID=UPI001016B6B2|nr:protein N-terminal asparagine amidohydrolase isoform X1 [Xiphophorus couchianus]
MPLFFQNRELDCFRSTAELFDKYPHLQENAKAFRSKPRVDVDAKHLLYVQQREFAATTPADNCVSILGSDDATTCHLVVLRHTGSGAVCLSHLDGSSTRTEVQLTMKAVTSLSNGCNEGRFELHLVGGFDDDDKRSHKLSLNILAAFQKQKDHIHLETCCITGFICFLSFANTVVRHSDFSVTILSVVEMNNVVDKGIHKPIVYGIGVNVKTGEVFPASFPHKGPAEMLRSARTFTGGEMTDIYDSRHGLIKVGPCQWSPDLEIAFWLSQSDATILKYLSTSPFAEPPHFVQHIKSTIQFLLSHPNSDSLFPGGQPHLYHWTESGSWERLVQS